MKSLVAGPELFHILHPVKKYQVIVLGEDSRITRIIISILFECLFCLLRLAIITFRQLVALNGYFSPFGYLNLHTREQGPYRFKLDIFVIV